MKVIMKTAFKGILAVTSIMIVAILIIIFVIPLNSKTLYLKGRVSDLFENTREAYKEYVRWVNRSNYRNILDKYIVDNYGEILKEYFEVQVINNYSSYNQLYSVSTPFMKKDFFIEVSYNKRKVISDTFNSVLSTDPKFQHMYSEWVKKQVGIEDENVEFKFTGFFDKPYIEFDKIVSLNSDYEEIFENTHNLFAWLCERTQIKDLSENNKVGKAKHLQEYLLSAMQFTGISNDTSENFSGCVRLSSGSFNKEKDLNFEFNFDARDNKYTLKSYIVGTGWVTYE